MVWFLCLMASQPSQGYLMPKHQSRKTVVVLFNLYLEGKVGSYLSQGY